MKTVSVNLYSFAELGDKAKEKAVNDHREFLQETPVICESESGHMESTYERYEDDSDVIENIEVNDYLYFEDGDLAHITHYCGNHERAGQTEFHFKGRTYNITNS